MNPKKLFVLLGLTAATLAAITAGCQQTPATAPALTVGELTTYKVTTTSERTLEFKGSLAENEGLKGGHTSKTVELVFTSDVLSVDEQGNATAEITIKQLSYFSQVKDRPYLRFDSTKDDISSSLGQLIGQSYRLEIAPDGQVTKVIDASEARAAVKGVTPANKAAQHILQSEVIMHIHSFPGVASDKINKLQPGDSWTDTKSFFLGMLGTKSYERTYTVDKITEADSHNIAVIQMQAVALDATGRQQDDDASGDLSDSPVESESFSGLLEFDLTNGKVKRYSERLETQWVMADPQAQNEPEPDAFVMGIGRSYSIVKID